jgi:hypothetical protein
MTRVDTSAGYLAIQLRLKILQGTLYCSYDHWWTEQDQMSVFLTKSLVSVLSIKHKITNNFQAELRIPDVPLLLRFLSLCYYLQQLSAYSPAI